MTLDKWMERMSSEITLQSDDSPKALNKAYEFFGDEDMVDEESSSSRLKKKEIPFAHQWR